MAKISKPEVRIFFSWQSDLLKDATTNAIRECLVLAATEIESEFPDIKIIIDEATRNIPGSPDIPTMIFEKIALSDIFVSDITTINSHLTEECRKTANPNVLIELGFSFCELGWERIIMVFNEEFGKFPADIAFDIDRKRISRFSVKNKSDKSGKAQLKILLTDAIRLIIVQNPLKPFEKKKLNPDEKKRALDILNLKRLIGTINISMLDNHIDLAPDTINARILYYFESFRGIYKSSSFFLYDKNLSKLIDLFYKYWNLSLASGEFYHDTPNQYILKFGNKYGVPHSPEYEKEYEKLAMDKINLNATFQNLLHYIRHSYMELDLDELSQKAHDEYVEFHKN